MKGITINYGNRLQDLEPCCLELATSVILLDSAGDTRVGGHEEYDHCLKHDRSPRPASHQTSRVLLADSKLSRAKQHGKRTN